MRVESMLRNRERCQGHNMEIQLTLDGSISLEKEKRGKEGVESTKMVFDIQSRTNDDNIGTQENKHSKTHLSPLSARPREGG